MPVSDSKAVPATVHHSQRQISAIMIALGTPIITVQPETADRLKLLNMRDTHEVDNLCRTLRSIPHPLPQNGAGLPADKLLR